MSIKETVIREKLNASRLPVKVINPIQNQKAEIGRLETELICLNLITFDQENVSPIILSHPTLNTAAKVMNSDIYYNKNEKQGNGLTVILSDETVRVRDMIGYFCFIERRNLSGINIPDGPMPSLLRGLYCYSNNIPVQSLESYRDFFQKCMLSQLKASSLESLLKSQADVYAVLRGLTGLPCVYIIKAYYEMNNSNFNQQAIRKSIGLLSSSRDYQDALSAALVNNPRKKPWLDILGKNGH